MNGQSEQRWAGNSSAFHCHAFMWCFSGDVVLNCDCEHWCIEVFCSFYSQYSVTSFKAELKQYTVNSVLKYAFLTVFELSLDKCGVIFLIPMQKAAVCVFCPHIHQWKFHQFIIEITLRPLQLQVTGACPGWALIPALIPGSVVIGAILAYWRSVPGIL